MVTTRDKPLTTSTATGSAKSEDPRESDAPSSELDDDGVQGEGNYEAAREFNEAERKFVASGMVDAAARAAAPTSEAEEDEMVAAEEKGKRRSKDQDQALTKAWPDPVARKIPGTDADEKRG